MSTTSLRSGLAARPAITSFNTENVIEEVVRLEERRSLEIRSNFYNLGGPPTTSTGLPDMTSVSAIPSTTSGGPPGATTTAGQGSNGPTNSPLLFFVALGFGVVFTNLWYVTIRLFTG